MTIDRPLDSEYAPYYKTYISKIENKLSLDDFERQLDELLNYLTENKGRLSYAYGENKWTIRQVFVHICDTEQIFLYRLLRIARGDGTHLAGFDQNAYIDNSDFSHLTFEDLTVLITNQRKQTISLLKSLREDCFLNIGEASKFDVSVRALAYMIYGHAVHHMQLFNERYS